MPELFGTLVVMLWQCQAFCDRLSIAAFWLVVQYLESPKAVVIEWFHMSIELLNAHAWRK
jgi:hypothetical protein